jgi:site-specific DNA recombinase
MGNVAIYARVSTKDKQDFKRQISDCLTAIGDKYSSNNIDTYPDKISGYSPTENRPQLEALLAKIKEDNGYYDCIYITEISRLGRDPKQTRNLIDDLTEKKIPIHITSINRQTLDENGERDTIMSIVIQVLIEFADSESRTMKKRSKSGLLQSAKDGKAGGSNNLPYGYYKENKTKLLLINEDEAKIIKEIFEYYKAGNGTKKIAGYLNEKNIPTRTNISAAGKTINFKIKKNADDIIWSDKQIHDILKNTLYKGERVFKGNIFDIEPIISEQLFDECTLIRTTKTHRNYLTTYTYILKDLLVCGCCGRNYFAKYKPVPNGDKVYICSSRLLKAGNCGNIGVNISLIESMVYDVIYTPAILKYIGDENVKEQLQQTIQQLETDLNIKTNELQSNKKEISILLNAHLKGYIKEEPFVDKNKELENTTTAINKSIEIIKKTLFENKDALDKFLDRNTTLERLSNAKNNRTDLINIVRQIINKIIVTKIDNNNVLISIFFKINGVEILVPLHYILDVNGVRKKPKQYNYLDFQKSQSNPIYNNNNILLVDVSEIKNEFETKLEYGLESNGLFGKIWITIKNENYLFIKESDI